MYGRTTDSDPVEIEPDPVIEAYKAHVDRTLIRENLKLSVTERFERMQALADFAAELRGSARRHRTSEAEAE